jgi:hypothetical protein
MICSKSEKSLDDLLQCDFLVRPFRGEDGVSGGLLLKILDEDAGYCAEFALAERNEWI